MWKSERKVARGEGLVGETGTLSRELERIGQAAAPGSSRLCLDSVLTLWIRRSKLVVEVLACL